MATTNWQSPSFIIYELMGFGGLGPGRLEIRAAGFSAFKSCLVPLVFYGSVIASVMRAGVSGLWRRRRNETFKIGLVVIATLLCLVAAGLLLHFRVLGRHCAPALPVVLVLLIEGVWIVGKWRGAAMMSVMVVLMASCLSARFAERHLKDDYRAAAARGREAAAAEKTVWWSADAQAAEFYGLRISAEQTNGAMVRLVLNPDDAALADAALPDIVICSKPDIYDVRGALGRKMVAGGFVETASFPAFRVMQRAGTE
jgi:fluoride ion exporter CrcB/FEX